MAGAAAKAEPERDSEPIAEPTRDAKPIPGRNSPTHADAEPRYDSAASVARRHSVAESIGDPKLAPRADSDAKWDPKNVTDTATETDTVRVTIEPDWDSEPDPAVCAAAVAKRESTRRTGIALTDAETVAKFVTVAGERSVIPRSFSP
jgi:hypothetical protein